MHSAAVVKVWVYLLTKDHFQLEKRLQLGRHDPCDGPAGRCLALVDDTSISGTRVAPEPDRIIAWRGQPQSLVKL
jgi:hypothetical protein